MEKIKHQCIKPGCPNSYEDTDPEAYYCPSCNEQKKIIAQQIDKKYQGLPRKEVVPRFTEKDFQGGGGRIFFNSSDSRIT